MPSTFRALTIPIIYDRVGEVKKLRETYPVFEYRDYEWRLAGDELAVSFTFALPPDFTFQPTVRIQGVGEQHITRAGEQQLNNLVFHLGLIEMLSYWKAACPPVIEVQCGALTDRQQGWWQDMLRNGLSEFFYVNRIDRSAEDLVSITTTENNTKPCQKVHDTARDKAPMVMLGGGKDSLVTWQLLQERPAGTYGFVLNGGNMMRRFRDHFPDTPVITASRTIDGTLLELNERGFLNGHTPFSAYLAFLSLIPASLFGIPHVVASNERSADEPNTTYLGSEVNHQWAKSHIFEEMFRSYINDYLVHRDAVNYFSYLRPVGELQVAKIFAGMPHFHTHFISCNRTGGEGWCGTCPKCLSTALVLSAFLSPERVTAIFDTSPLDNEHLRPLFLQLMGEQGVKPFECVATTREIRAAAWLAIEQCKRHDTPLPALLEYARRIAPPRKEQHTDIEQTLHTWSRDHHIPRRYIATLKRIALR